MESALLSSPRFLPSQSKHFLLSSFKNCPFDDNFRRFPIFKPSFYGFMISNWGESQQDNGFFFFWLIKKEETMGFWRNTNLCLHISILNWHCYVDSKTERELVGLLGSFQSSYYGKVEFHRRSFGGRDISMRRSGNRIVASVVHTTPLFSLYLPSFHFYINFTCTLLEFLLLCCLIWSYLRIVRSWLGNRFYICKSSFGIRVYFIWSDTLMALFFFFQLGKKVKKDTVIPDPDYRIPIVLLSEYWIHLL